MARSTKIIRWTGRLILAAVLAVGLGYLPYKAYGPGGLPRIIRLRDELTDLTQKNGALRNHNRRLRQQIESLKNDHRAIERVARDELGLVRSRDIIFLFE